MNIFMINRNTKSSIIKNGRQFLKFLFSGSLLFKLYIALLSMFLLAPIIIVVLISFSSESYAVFPPKNYSLKWYINFFNSSEFVSAFKMSLILAITVVIITLLLGTLVSYAIVRINFPGKNIVHSFLLLPIMFPAIILSLSLLIYFTRIKIIGTFIGLVFAHTLLATPFVIKSLVGCLSTIQWSTNEAAQCLGANRLQSFFYIILPQIKFGLIAAVIFAFITSFDEVVISLFIVGAKTKTLPVYIYNYLEYTSDPTIAAIATMIIVVIGIIILLIPKNYLTSIASR